MNFLRTFVLVFLLCPITALAQGTSGRRNPECRATLNKLGANPRSEAFQRALRFGKPSACGAEGGVVMARVLRESIRAVAEAGFLGRFVLQASANRHPAIFDAALAAARDQSLPTAVRVGAVQIALGQHDVRYFVPRNLDVPAPNPLYERVCAFDIVGELGFQSEQPLPGDYRARLQREMQSLAADSAGPVAVRRSAQCVVYILTATEGLEVN